MSSSKKSPWEAWALNRRFLESLDVWNEAHPEDSFDRVLGRVCAAIDKGDYITKLIPDNPFPARSLVEALGQLIKFGANIKSAKREVYGFANEIAGWIVRESSAFRTNVVSSKTWAHLNEMHSLIEDICLWANKRLKDGWFRRIGHGLTIESEIDEFKNRLKDASFKFMHLSMITISGNQDEAITEIRYCTARIRAEEERLAVLLDELLQQKRESYISKILSPFLATNATYTAQAKDFCHPKTRIDILNNINNWVHDFSDNVPHLLWLTGQPGSGKSSITATISQALKDSGELWAQCFINRNYTNTTQPRAFFPTIVQQLADQSPKMALYIHDVLKRKPSLVDSVTDLQAKLLFLEPLIYAANCNSAEPIVVVIDALDECDPAFLWDTAKIISDVIGNITTHNLKVILSSRVEDDIQFHFGHFCNTQRVQQIDLDTTTDASIRDVSIFIRQEINNIVDQFRLRALQWPGEGSMRHLCEQASGLFIWGVTATKFIRAQIKLWGSGCLNSLLNELLTKGMDDINKLYSTILDKTFPIGTDEWLLEVFRRVVGSIVVISEPLSLDDLKALHNLRMPNTDWPVDVVNFVRQFRTVLVAGTGEITGQTFPRLHKSFFEFIISDHVQPRFRVDRFASNKELAPKCYLRFQALDTCFRRSSRPKVHDYYLNAAITCYDAYINDSRLKVIAKPPHYHSLGVTLSLRFKLLRDQSDLTKAISVCKEAVRLTLDHDPDKPLILTTLSSLLAQRFLICGEAADINRSIALLSKAVNLIPDNRFQKSSLLSDLGVLLMQRFEKLEGSAYIDKAITTHADAVRVLAPSNIAVDKCRLLCAMGSAYRVRARQSPQRTTIQDIDKSILAFQGALRLCGKSDFLPILADRLDRIMMDAYASSQSHDAAYLGHLAIPYRLIPWEAKFVKYNHSIKAPSEITPTNSIWGSQTVYTQKPQSFATQAQTVFGANFQNPTRFNSNPSTFETRNPPVRRGSAKSGETFLGTSFDESKEYPDDVQVGIFWALGDLRSLRRKLSCDDNDINLSISAYEQAILLTTDSHIKICLLMALSLPLSVRIERGGPLIADDHKRSLSLCAELRNHSQYLLSCEGDDLWKSVSSASGYDADLKPQVLLYVGHLTAKQLSSRWPNAANIWDQPTADLETTVSYYVEALWLTPDHHPDKPSMLEALGEAYGERSFGKAISAYEFAILFIRKYGYSQTLQSWKYSASAEYNATHPQEQEERFTIRLLHLIAYGSGSPRSVDLSERVEILDNLDSDMFGKIKYHKGVLPLLHLRFFLRSR